MDVEIFLARLDTVLSRQRSKILDQELENDFAILKRQREGESVPPKRYWALKSFPREFQISYIKCVAQGKGENCDKVKNSLLLREQQTAKLVLEEWAEHPSMEAANQQIEKWHQAAVEYDKRTGYYSGQIRNLCKKAEVKSAFRAGYLKTAGRKMRTTEESSVFADEVPVVIGDARIIVEWDCGGWSHFREGIGVEWRGKMAFRQQSLCSWLGYYPAGTEGWSWILKDDLERAAQDAVQQTIQFRDILVEGVRKALE